MQSLNPVLVGAFGLGMFVLGVLVTAALLRAIRRRRPRRRVVELPNSHYTAPLAKQSEDRHRWHGMPLEGIHEINRVEVVRLLAKAEAAGVNALGLREREFLDHMSELARRPG